MFVWLSSLTAYGTILFIRHRIPSRLNPFFNDDPLQRDLRELMNFSLCDGSK